MISKFRRRLLINAAKKNDKITYPGLIAAWSAKGKSNDDADRTVLRDLTGNGHDITLNNFAFSEMSGYNGFKYGKGKYVYTSIYSGLTVFKKTPVNGNFSFKTTGLKEALENVFGLTLEITAYYEDGHTSGLQFSYDTGDLGPGEEYYTYEIPEGVTHISMLFFGMGNNPNCNVTIEFLPEYPDALVFDGVDDYGINKDMPTLTDYTIIAEREFLYPSSGLAGKDFVFISYTRSLNYARALDLFSLESRYINYYAVTFATQTQISVNNNRNIVYQNKTNYNGKDILCNEMSSEGFNTIRFGRILNNYTPMAFYSAYLFDRSLDEQEIKSFIRKYIDADYVLPSEQTTE